MSLKLQLTESKFKNMLTEMVKEVLLEFNNFNHLPDNIEELPDVIRLYHSTNEEGIEGILESGIIDANKGTQRGETSGMNWFSIKPIENFGNYMFSIDVPKEYFINYEMKPHFYIQNNVHCSTYDSINIHDFNFQILKFNHVDLESLQNLMRKCNNDDDVFYQKLRYLLSNDEDSYISTVIYLYILEKLKGKQYLYDAGYLE